MAMKQVDKDIVLALAKCDMNVSETSKLLNYHRNTVDYHIKGIRTKHGLNPLRFYDLIKLVKIAKGGAKNG